MVEDASGLPLERLRGRRVGVVVQTTQTRANLSALAAALAPVARELLVFNTVCDATEKRQSAACELADEVDVVVVVGGRNSANTARLAQLCAAIEPRTHHIESAAELRPEWLEGAGAHRRHRRGLDAGRGDRGHRARVAGPVRWSEAARAPARGVVVADARDAAERGGVRAGDRIVRLNGEVPMDVLDVEDAAADGALWFTVLRDGRPLDLVITPGPGEWHGISLDRGGLGDDPRTCRNACRFCFVDQVPPGLRGALSVKDDDYRLSFLHGNFMTLTNLGEDDLERIEELRLSPLYVSLHAWDDDARVRLMGRAAAGSRAVLERLAAAGLVLHLQVVLCPGWNDGDVLAETVQRTAELDTVADLGVVPVSLAAEGDLRRVTADAGACPGR